MIKKPKWITILSDNGAHYYCMELMLIIAYWPEWYNVISRKWIFLEAGEAKTSINSYHAQVILTFYFSSYLFILTYKFVDISINKALYKT